MGRPDALHLHSLVYRRVLKARRTDSRQGPDSNAITSVYLWLVAVVCAAPALIYWRDTSVLVTLSVGFAVAYVLIYRRLLQSEPASAPSLTAPAGEPDSSIAER
jgi:hypothetical protein